MAPAGNLTRYYKNWINITHDSFILNIIQTGYKIQLYSSKFDIPPVISTPSKTNKIAILAEIDSLLCSGAVSKVSKAKDDLVSRVFLVKKKNGSNRMILDLSSLNHFVVKSSFKMEDKNTIISLIEKNDFLVSIDLTEAFHSVPLNPLSKRLTCFQIDEQRFCYNCLPFGLSSSPRIFSKILKSVIAFLRSRNIKITFYLDDLLIISPSFKRALEDRDLTVSLLCNLGFSINLSKSHLVPCQSLSHLGYLWDSRELSIKLPSDKISKIKSLAASCLCRNSSLRTLAALLGLLVNASNAFPFAPLHYRNFQFCFIEGLNFHSSWESFWELSEEARMDLDWWVKCDPLSLSPFLFAVDKPTLSIFTDASNSGWGASLSSGEITSGFWPNSLLDEHINFLELKAIHFSILHFLDLLEDKVISIRCDNSSAVYYLNKKGGTHSKKLCLLALEIWNLARLHNFKIIASHISGIDNSSADYLSRFSHYHEYGLSHHAFKLLLDILPFRLSLDLFASKDNALLEDYVSIFEDSEAFHINAFSFSWPSEVYLFPPIPLIPKTILKFLRDNVDLGLLVTPAWHTLSVLPLIEKSLVYSPIFIPSSHLVGCLPIRHSFPLMGWPISGDCVKRKTFQTLFQEPYSKASTMIHSNLIPASGKALLNGLISKGLDPIFLPP